MYNKKVSYFENKRHKCVELIGTLVCSLHRFLKINLKTEKPQFKLELKNKFNMMVMYANVGEASRVFNKMPRKYIIFS